MSYISVLLLAVMTASTLADVYLHNPRGSNNRWDENSRNRNNANRMFDSQNNDRGGYNIGSVYYYAGSKLRVEWTNQHSCGNENNNCNIVMQYMCGNLVRDGTTTSTIPKNPAQCNKLDCNQDLEFGMHEDFYYYHHCRLRTRNKGLFISRQNVGEAAINTRQNRKGNRYAYECSEERDYYPYWGPTPWKDIVIFTNDVERCELFRNESQNVKSKFACKVSQAYLYQYANTNPGNNYIPITQEECEAFQYTVNGVTENGTWTEYPAHGIDAPECTQAQYSRDNHLGNGVGGETLNYNWTIPNIAEERCTLRIRYNISTGDYNPFNTSNQQNNRARRDGNGPDIWTRQGLTEEEGVDRGYEIKDDPEVDMFGLGFDLRLAVDTAQYGRTFQDRTHRFAIRERPADIAADANIVNVNVRGKRGNIVQVYPGVEYDFVPNTAVVQNSDYVHYQWTGSDNNPNNNDGQGRQGSDRSNVAMLKPPVYSEGNPGMYKADTWGQLGASYPAQLSDAELGGLPFQQLMNLATLINNQFGGNMDELDAAGTYYDAGAQKVTMTGVFNYMSTRNNNFSNRSQKGRLIVTNSEFSQSNIDEQGGTLALQSDGPSTSVVVPPMAFEQGTYLELWEMSVEESGVITEPTNNDYVSNFVQIRPQEQFTQGHVDVAIALTQSINGLYLPNVYRSVDGGATWVQIEFETHDGGVVAFRTDTGGNYVVSRSVNIGPLVGVILGTVIAVILLVAIVFVLHKNKILLKSYQSKV